MKENTLDELAILCDTDKASLYRGNQGHYYTTIYEKYFEPIRRNNLNILEIGIASGGSLKLLELYFENSTIHGLDIDPTCSTYGTGRSKVFIGSQTDKNMLDNISSSVNGFDIVIDDGSHLIEDIIFSFENLIDKMNNNSLYIIEDLHDCLRRGHEWDLVMFLKDRLQDLNFNNKFFGTGNNTSNSNLAIESLENSLTVFERKIESIHIYTGLIIFQMR